MPWLKTLDGETSCLAIHLQWLGKVRILIVLVLRSFTVRFTLFISMSIRLYIQFINVSIAP